MLAFLAAVLAFALAASVVLLPLFGAQHQQLHPLHTHNTNLHARHRQQHDRDELAALRDDLETELAGIACNNPRALEEFTRRQREIGDLRARADAEERALGALHAEIAAVRVRGGGGEEREQTGEGAAAVWGMCHLCVCTGLC